MDNGIVFALLSVGIGLAALTLVRARLEKNILVACIGALILIGAGAGLTILASQAGSLLSVDLSERLELMLTTAAGPATLVTVARLLRTPLPLWIPASLGAGGFGILLLTDMKWGGDPIIFAIPLQVLFTLWAWLLVVRDRAGRHGRRSRAWRLRRIAIVLLGAVSLVNAASLVRLAFPQIEQLRPLVPWTLGLVFLAGLVVLVWLALARHAPALPDVGARAEGEAMVGRLAAMIAAEQLFRDRCFRIEDAANRLGEPVAALGAALAHSEYGSFAVLLQSIRLDRAERLLVDPGERATSIDAIGMLCGFGSRSTFYDAFEQRFGMAPGKYRKRAQSLSGD